MMARQEIPVRIAFNKTDLVGQEEMEMLQKTKQIVARTYEPLVLYIEVGLIYLAFSTILTWLQGRGERRLSTHRVKRRRNENADA